jgi:hypothetical protein
LSIDDARNGQDLVVGQELFLNKLDDVSLLLLLPISDQYDFLLRQQIEAKVVVIVVLDKWDLGKEKSLLNQTLWLEILESFKFRLISLIDLRELEFNINDED